MSLQNYYDFAENDRMFIMAAHQNGMVYNSMCSLAQKVCERYLKHYIEKYYIPEDEASRDRAAEVMRAHSLTKLERFLRDAMEIDVDEATHNAIRDVNGYYYETSYPGEDSFFVNERDIETAVAAMTKCKVFIDRLIVERDGHDELESGDDIER